MICPFTWDRAHIKVCCCNIMREKEEENFEIKIFCPSAKKQCEKYRENCNLSQGLPFSCKRYHWNQRPRWREYCRLPAPHSCLPTGVGKSCSALSRSLLLAVRRVSTVWDCWAEEIRNNSLLWCDSFFFFFLFSFWKGSGETCSFFCWRRNLGPS